MIVQSQLRQAEFSRVVYRLEYPNLKDTLAPGFYAHVGHLLKKGDRIEVFPADQSFFAELLVLGAAKQWAKVEVLSHVEFGVKEAVQAEQATDLRVEHNPKQKWRVLRGKDVLSKDHETRDCANAWMLEHADKVS